MEGNENVVTPLENVFNQPATSEPPAESAPAEPAPDEPITGEPPPAPPADDDEHPQVKAFKAKAIDEAKKRQKLEQDYAALQRQNAEYQQYLQRLAQQQQAQQPPQQQQRQGIRPEQFQTYEAYLEAVAEAKAEAKAQEIFERNMQRAVQVQQQQTVQRQAAEDLQDMIKAGKEKYPDFEQVVGSQHVPITEVMMTTMMAIDGGHEIAYSLGMNPAEAARIARMPPSSQAREIGKLAREIAAAAAASAAPAVTTAPVAPPLPKTLTQTRSAGGQFTKTWTGPTPLDDIFRKK